MKNLIVNGMLALALAAGAAGCATTVARETQLDMKPCRDCPKRWSPRP